MLEGNLQVQFPELNPGILERVDPIPFGDLRKAPRKALEGI